jgi:hypothetical protein
VKCPIPIYSKGWQNGTLWYTRIVTPIVSLLLLIFICIQLYQWKFWMVFPRYYLVYNSFFIFIALIPYLMFAFSGGYSEIGCKNKVETANNDIPACNFANWALYIGRPNSFSSFSFLHLLFGNTSFYPFLLLLLLQRNLFFIFPSFFANLHSPLLASFLFVLLNPFLPFLCF